MPDRHKHHPKAVRMPDGLLAWYEERAPKTGRSVNALLVAALEDYRLRHDAAPARPNPKAPKPYPSSDRGDCPHPKACVIKGFCGACGTRVG